MRGLDHIGARDPGPAARWRDRYTPDADYNGADSFT
jgi:hypothetical protein